MEPTRKPTITVAIPCYNSCRYLENTVAAIRRQTVCYQELLVVDDGSSDDSPGLAERLGCKVIRHERNQGLGSTRNTALLTTESEFIVFVDADVVLDKRWISIALSAIDVSSASHVGGQLIELHRYSSVDKWRLRHMPQGHGRTDVRFDKFNLGRLAGFATMSRCDALRAIGGFNPAFTKAYEDVDICQRLIAAGYSLKYFPALVAYHNRRDSLTSLLRSSWNWEFWPAQLGGKYNSIYGLMSKITWNISDGLSLARLHAQNREHSLWPIDMLLILLFSWWDIRYYLNRTLMHVKYLFGGPDPQRSR